MPSSTLIFANAQKGVEVAAVAVKLASNAALFATTVRDNHAPTPLNNKT
jgi:phosphoribosylcarboxyaminoimidazole (NCAIR) mutase